MSSSKTKSENLSLSFAGEDPVEVAIESVDRSPCAVGCPAGVNVKAYVTLIAAGRFREALEIVRAKNPFPGICGRVCTHPCEESCNRAKIDEPVAIRDLKRYIADWEIENPVEAKAIKPERLYDENVAVVGSGPAGITAANDLIRMGYGVTVFEALDRTGGMMVTGIPPFRLPRHIIAAEIKAVEDQGVEIRTNTPLGPELSLDDILTKEGFSAVFLAIGAHKGRKLGIPGEDAGLDAVQFLRVANLTENAEKAGDKVVVVGGGNSAIDAARMSLRLGSEEVRIVYRRTREEMPADEGEIEEALEEGIGLDYLATPLEVVLEDGKTVGLKVIRNELGEPDDSGRRRPVPIEGSEYVIPCDRVIAAISQSPDLDFLGDDHGIKLTRWNTFETDEATMMTSRKGVFAGGDAWAGPASVVDAIRDGHHAAMGIHCLLSGEPIPEPKKRPFRPGDYEVRLQADEVEPHERVHLTHTDPHHRRRSFQEVAQGFTEQQAKDEAARCMHCGPCEECEICVSICDRKLFVTERDGEDVFVRLPAESAAYKKAHAHLQAMLTTKNVDGGEKEKENVTLEPVTAFVMEALCRGCGDCADVCEYSAPHLITKVDGKVVSEIDENLCRGCGTCTAICPSGAIVSRHFTDEWVEKKLKAALLG
jgi:heterodisulfide reductase subunit A2